MHMGMYGHARTRAHTPPPKKTALLAKSSMGSSGVDGHLEKSSRVSECSEGLVRESAQRETGVSYLDTISTYSTTVFFSPLISRYINPMEPRGLIIFHSALNLPRPRLKIVFSILETGKRTYHQKPGKQKIPRNGHLVL